MRPPVLRERFDGSIEHAEQRDDARVLRNGIRTECPPRAQGNT